MDKQLMELSLRQICGLNKAYQLRAITLIAESMAVNAAYEVKAHYETEQEIKAQEEKKEATIPLEIGIKIRTARKLLRMTANELAYRSGLSMTAILNYEHLRRVPSIENLSKICDALGVHLSDFIRER